MSNNEKKMGIIVRPILLALLVTILLFQSVSATDYIGTIPEYTGEIPLGGAELSIFIHPSEKAWDSKEFSKECDSYWCRENEILCCDEKWCYPGMEGNYEYTFVIWPHTGANGEETEAYPKTGTAPWGPVDYDSMDWACQSCAKADWSEDVPTSNKCCGDDETDCGTGGGTFVCTDTPMTSKVAWLDSKDDKYKGVVVDSLCSSPDSAYLSTDTGWILCGQNTAFPGKKFDLTINDGPQANEVANPFNSLEHGYACIFEDPKFEIAECCGGSSDESPKCTIRSSLGGITLRSGNSVELSKKIYFCREDKKFSEDLDDAEYACKNAKNPDGKVLGYKWTGTKCCAEPEDSPEYYNDPGNLGACFQSTPYMNEARVEGQEELIVVDGQLKGCKISANNYNSDNNWLLSLTDSHTNQILIEEVEYCTVAGYFYCDYSEVWLESYGQDRSNLVYVPEEWLSEEGIVSGGCCAQDSCWTGSFCMENQAPYPTDAPYKGDYRCIDGTWEYSEKKTDLNGLSGYCPSNDQCLVSVSGNADNNNNPDENPMCIQSGQYVRDYYCEGGDWSSRTKYIALELLGLVSESEDYTLYCGSPGDTLNYINYVTSSGVYIQSLFEENKLNNICILDYDGKLLLGTSYNPDPETNEDIIAGIFDEFIGCNPIVDVDEYVSCDGQSMSKAWKNPYLRSIIYSTQTFSLDDDWTLGEIFSSFISNPVSTLLNMLQQGPTTQPFSYEFISNGMRFDKLYVAKKSDKNIIATLDEDTVVVKYEDSVSEDICEIISTYDTLNQPSNSQSNAKIACTKSDNAYNIIATGGDYANINPSFIWSDLTGKLRLE